MHARSALVLACMSKPVGPSPQKVPWVWVHSWFWLRLATGGRLVFLLEGGYQVDAVGESVAETFLALLGQPSREAGRTLVLPREEPLAEVRRLVKELRALHGLR